MAGWTGHESAIWIRGSVQNLQDRLDFSPRDGKYSAALNRKLQAALIAAGLRDQADKLATEGPAGLTLFPGTQVSWEDIAVAWAWWVKLRGKPPYPPKVDATILASNEALIADGDAPLTAKDAEEFIGDAPPATSGKTVLYVLGGIMGAAVIATLGVIYGRRSCPTAATE